MRLPTRLLLLAATVTACADATAPDADPTLLPLEEGPIAGTTETRSVSLAYQEADSILVTVPTQARRGVPVVLRLTVTSGGCIGRDTTVVRTAGRTASVVPYSKAPIDLSAILCAAGPLRDERATAITFTQSGETRVRIVFRVGPSNSLRIIERRVLVAD